MNIYFVLGNRNVDLRLPVDSTELIDMFYSIDDQIHHRMTCSFYAGLLEQVGASEFVKEIESLSMEVLLSRQLVVEVEVKIINGEINVEEKVFHIDFQVEKCTFLLFKAPAEHL